jgi:hypothetical protein
MQRKINKILVHNGDYRVLLENQETNIPIINISGKHYSRKKRILRFILMIFLNIFGICILSILFIITIKFLFKL